MRCGKLEFMNGAGNISDFSPMYSAPVYLQQSCFQSCICLTQSLADLPMGLITSRFHRSSEDELQLHPYKQCQQDPDPGVGDIRLRQPMALSVDLGSEGGGGPSSGDEEKPIRAVQPRRNFPTIYALAVVAAFTLLFTVVYGIDQWLPSPLGQEEIISQPERYNALRAYETLKELVQIGVKTAGSRNNDYTAREWVEEQLNLITATVHKSKRVEVDTQYITGSFHLAFQNRFTSAYSGLVNVVARLSDIRSNSSEALLVNCHFDSVQGSPGASDDGINCAHMLEILSILSRQSTLLTHSIIFLFNGAEENGLQASHGFITQHKWANFVKAFVNLEACGAGGREILFQAAVEHPWLLEAYAESVPHPHGFVIGEEIFQTGLIPSDTDFRIFRDFSQVSSVLPGLDFAYYRNGYVYHTAFDDLNQTSRASMQHTGENLLALITNLANSPYLNGPHEHAGNRTVYYDLFGFKMVHYSQTTGAVIGLSVILLSVYTTVSTLLHLGPGMRRKELCFQGMKALLGPFFGWVMAFVWCSLVAEFLDFLMNTMMWYSQPLYLIPLYALPTFLFATLGLYLQYVLTQLSPLSGDVRVQLYSLGVQLIWTVLLMTLTLLRSRSAYILQFMVFFPSLASFLVLWFARPGGKIGTWLWLQLGALIVPISIAFYHILSFMALIIPIMGRVGAHVNSELLVALFTCMCTLLCTSYLAPMVLLLRNPRRVFEVLGMIHLIGVGLAISPLSFPYSGLGETSPTPQRVYILQVQRQFVNTEQQEYHSDSGLWFLNMDRNSPSALLSEMPALGESRMISPHCGNNLTCGLPIYSPRWLGLCPGSLWLPTNGLPNFVPSMAITLKQKKKINGDVYRMEFDITGPSHLGVVLCPYRNVTLEASSLAKDVLPVTEYFYKRPFYFVYVGRGFDEVGKLWKFSIDLKVPLNHAKDLIDVVAVGHYFTDVPYGPELTAILNNKPTWLHATVWSSWYLHKTF